MANDTGGNEQVEFVWGGTLPPQGNTMRLDDGYSTDVLDEDLGDHILYTSGYQGFPEFITDDEVYEDLVANVAVPDVVGLTESAAEDALEAVDLVKGAVTTANNAAGATALNDGKVKTQTPAADTIVNVGDSVALVKYVYTP